MYNCKQQQQNKDKEITSLEEASRAIRKLKEDNNKAMKKYNQELARMQTVNEINERRRNEQIKYNNNQEKYSNVRGMAEMQQELNEQDAEELRKLGVKALNINPDGSFAVQMDPIAKEEVRDMKRQRMIKMHGASKQVLSEIENPNNIEKQFRLMDLIVGTGASGSGSSRTNANTKPRNNDDDNNNYRPTTIKGASSINTPSKDTQKIIRTYALMDLITGRM